jgi:AraC family transcriptional regulator, transcriptional activator of pobA
MRPTTLEDFYKDTSSFIDGGMDALSTAGKNKGIGHFNVFSIEDLINTAYADKINPEDFAMPYNRRTYYKISLVRGKNIAEYADKVIHIDQYALLFATPKIPYNWIPQDIDQKGYFCVFNDDFLIQSKSGVVLDELPLFRPGGYPLFQLSEKESDELVLIFRKMINEITSDYAYKYDLLRNIVMELIHYGQKLQPYEAHNNAHNASTRVTSLFIELLERQFPIASPEQKIILRTANDYADRLAVHINHLNKVLKESTGKTTTEHISNRLIQEAKILLMQTDWNISEIAYSLGFEQLSHFSNFFKKQTSLSPLEIRNQIV